jgi:hypothetical protein
MELGEHIELHGFVDDEFGELVIVKKLVGNHVKRLVELVPGYERLVLTRTQAGTNVTIAGVLHAAGNAFEASGEDDNVFFAIDKCLKNLLGQAR